MTAGTTGNREHREDYGEREDHGGRGDDENYQGPRGVWTGDWGLRTEGCEDRKDQEPWGPRELRTEDREDREL